MPKNPSAPRHVRRELIEELQRENAELKERLGMNVSDLEFETWEQTLAQDVRDDLAVRAILLHAGNVTNALLRLGFRIPASDAARRELAFKVFDTAGVKDRLAASHKDIEEERQAIIARQVQIAKFADDDRTATAAAMLISRIAGWQKVDGPPPAGAQNVQFFLRTEGGVAISGSGPQVALGGPDLVLGHEPGEPIPVVSSPDEPL